MKRRSWVEKRTPKTNFRGRTQAPQRTRGLSAGRGRTEPRRCYAHQTEATITVAPADVTHAPRSKRPPAPTAKARELQTARRTRQTTRPGRPVVSRTQAVKDSDDDYEDDGEYKDEGDKLEQLLELVKGLKTRDIAMEQLETIKPSTLMPWEIRMPANVDGTGPRQLAAAGVVYVAVSSSARNGVVGCGGAIELPQSIRRTGEDTVMTLCSALSTRNEQNPYSGELVAVVEALSMLPQLRFRRIVLMTRNRAAALALERPRQQSGQAHIIRAYESIRQLRRRGNVVTLLWLHLNEESDLLKRAKDQAKMATRVGCLPQAQLAVARSTTLGLARARLEEKKQLPENVGKYSRRIDKSLPGKHTRQLYDNLKHHETSILAQLRTGMARVNTYLHRIGAAATDECECGHAKETVEHFLFRCRRWDQHRGEMMQQTTSQRGNISYYVGGKTATDDENWAPDMNAVRATMRYAIATGRLNAN